MITYLKPLKMGGKGCCEKEMYWNMNKKKKGATMKKKE
jgi:hypothetical protein